MVTDTKKKMVGVACNNDQDHDEYKELLKKANTVLWECVPCEPHKEECWCRVIKPVEDIIYKDENIWISRSGELHKEHAEHIVEIHNKQLKGKT